jgi:hypothetical protein
MKRMTTLLACFAVTSTLFASLGRAETPRDIAWAANHAVNGHCSATNSLDAPTAACVMYTVPAGKRLVVETVTYLLSTLATSNVFTNLTFGYSQNGTTPAPENTYNFAVNPVVLPGNGLQWAYGTLSLRMYLDEHQSLMGSFAFSPATGVAQEFGFSGYLVDKE